VTSGYDPRGYWSERLSADYSLRATGCAGFSERYNDWLYRRKADVLSEALAEVCPSAHVLDIGSGTGWVVRQLLQRGMRVDGCDIAEVSVERLTAEFPESAFFRASVGAEPLPQETGSYDAVTMLDVAYHIVDDEMWRSAVAEVGRVLRPGGQFVVTDRLGEAPARVAEHVSVRSRAEWELAARPAGIRIVRVEPLYRLLGRGVDVRGWRRLPDDLRGRIEYISDTFVRVGSPHLRWALMVRE
jgi:SAM-dependent methyltransferase